MIDLIQRLLHTANILKCSISDDRFQRIDFSFNRKTGNETLAFVNLHYDYLAFADFLEKTNHKLTKRYDYEFGIIYSVCQDGLIIQCYYHTDEKVDELEKYLKEK